MVLSPPPATQEYEERLARLRADYKVEQESRARLEEDITAMRNSYDVKLSTLEESLRKETGARLPRLWGPPASRLILLLAFIEHFVRTRGRAVSSSQQPAR